MLVTPTEGDGARQPGIILAAMDKFRGTASARDLNDTVARVAGEHGHDVDLQLVSDGGEGFIDAFPGDVVTLEVPGALSHPVEARIKVDVSSGTRRAVLEVADVVGRNLRGNPSGADALAATSDGVGHLILAAVRMGANSVLVGCGDTATSDAGLGCYQVLSDAGGVPVPVTAATDVTARFSGALRYAVQKGVDPGDLGLVEHRFSVARARYLDERGVDVEALERTGAAGGLSGALVALGAYLTSGFDAVAGSVELLGRVERASLVVTGEGRLDLGSLEGKVAVGLATMTDRRSDLLVVCGAVDHEARRLFLERFPRAALVSLEDRFGVERSSSMVLECLAIVVRDHLEHRAHLTARSPD